MKVLLLGPDGQVGWELRRSLAPVAEVIAATRSGTSARGGDLEFPEQLREMMRTIQPHVVVNAAAYTAVDAAESNRERAWAVNGIAPGILAEESARLDSLLIHFSTDYVFDGSGSAPWSENDATGPLNVYGETKLGGETLIRSSGCRHLIFRTSWIYATRGKNFLRTMLKLASERDKLSVVEDQHGAPTGAELVADVTAHAALKVIANPALAGTYHLSAAGETTWHGYACHAIETARGLGDRIRVARKDISACRTADFPSPARRPHNSRLSTTRLCEAFDLVLPQWQTGVDRAIREIMHV